eukprot:487765_1
MSYEIAFLEENKIKHQLKTKQPQKQTQSNKDAHSNQNNHISVYPRYVGPISVIHWTDTILHWKNHKNEDKDKQKSNEQHERAYSLHVPPTIYTLWHRDRDQK